MSVVIPMAPPNRAVTQGLWCDNKAANHLVPWHLCFKSEKSGEAGLHPRRPVWNWLGIGRVKGPQSRAWKVLTTARVDGERWQGARETAGMVAWYPGITGRL